MRAAVSRFLTMFLGDKYHPYRREVVKGIPRARESRGRVPDRTPELFWKLIEKTPEHARPAFVTLALTGLRIRSEYLKLEEHHLLPHTRSIEVPGTKTEGAAGEPEARIQASLRHEDPAMTRRYTRQRDRGEVARTMDAIMFPDPDDETTEETA